MNALQTKRLERIQRLAGERMIVSFEDEEYKIKPVDVQVGFKLTSADFLLPDAELVKQVIDPMIQNALGYLDGERPHAKTAHQRMMERFKDLPEVLEHK